MIEKLVKKWERHAIPGFMRYIVLLYAAGFLVGIINQSFYYEWLMLDIDKVLEGQIWRLVTFIIQPMSGSGLLMEALMLFIYYSIGTSIERLRGASRFNLFYFNGVIINIVCQVIIYIGTYLYYGVGLSYPVSLTYFNNTLFLALALMLPDMTFLLMFFIPVKAKYFVIIYAVMFGYQIFEGFYASPLIGICTLLLITAAVYNMLLFYRPWGKHIPGQRKRQKAFMNNFSDGIRYNRANNAGPAGNRTAPGNVTPFPGTVTRHKCAVCGRTERDGYDLEFRFCSKCNGNYEYCMEHIGNHTHVE
ncbi:MAG: rhomboid family intramembrane serine protease [Lachnospiraceae bacterium]|nr:rhomboid family intramembrane serine protease [Lachnospiraceae bacterium]